MRKIWQRLFAVVCVLMLVASTFAPVAVEAATDYPLSLSIVNESETTRVISSAEGQIVEETPTNSDFYPIYLNYDGTNKLLYAKYIDNLSSNTSYRLVYNIDFSENNEQYHYFDEIVLTGEQLLQLKSLALPQNLSKTKIVDTTGSAPSNNIVFDHVTGKDVSSYWVSGDSWIVKDASKDIALSFMTQVHRNSVENGYTPYILSSPLDFSKEANDIVNLEPQAVKVTKDTDVSSIHIQNVNGGSSYGSNTDFYVTPGSYNIGYNVNNIYWKGEVNLSAPTTLDLPTEPEKIVVNNIKQYTDYKVDNMTEFYFNAQYSVGSFTSQYYSIASPPKVSVVDATGKVVQANVSYNGSTAKVEFLDKSPSGNYTAKFDFSYDVAVAGTTETKTITLPIVEIPFTYESPWQTLQGAVVKAENAAGEVMTDTVVTLYQKRDGYYKKVFSEKDISPDGELFIPDTYLLKDEAYVLVATSPTQKVTYVHEFIGQSENNFLFDSATLKNLTVKTPGEYFSNVFYRLKDKNSRVIDVPFYAQDSKLSTNMPVKIHVGGVAENTAGTVGYVFEGTLDENYSLDLSTSDWKSVKPAAKYTNAYVSANWSGAQYSELFFLAGILGDIGLHVEDNGINYFEGKPVTPGEEVSFSTYTGAVNMASPDFIALHYTSANNNYINISGTTASFTYAITNTDGEKLEVTTNNLDKVVIPSTSKLAPGNYTIELVKSTINTDIVALSLNTTFTVEETPTAGVEISDKLPETITFNEETSYGQLQSWNKQLTIFQKYENGKYGYRAQYYSRAATNELTLSYQNQIDMEGTYLVAYSAELPFGDKIIDKVELTGAQLYAFLQKPITFSSNLLEVVLDQSALTKMNTTSNSLSIRMSLFGESSAQLYSSMYKNQVKLYMPAGLLKITINNDDSVNKTKTVSDVFNGYVEANQTITFSDQQLLKITAQRNGETLKQFAWTQGKGYSQYGSLINGFNALYMSPQTFKTFTLGVAVKHSATDSPWGYILSLDNETISADKVYNFSGAITGDITNVSADSYSYEDGTEGYTDIAVNYQLSSDNYKVDNIFVAQDRLTQEITPIIRDYYGMLDNLEDVPVSYKITNSKNEEVASGISSNYGLSYFRISLNEQLPSDVYKLTLNVPTAPREALKLTKEFVVGAPTGVSFVTLTAPATVTNTATVKGLATPNTTVQVQLMQGQTQSATQTVTADANGTFAAYFTSVVDGAYTAVATVKDANNVEKSVSKEFTLDQTPPSQVTKPTVTESDAGLNISWTAVEGVKQYDVLVKTGNGDFVKASSQATTEFTFKDIQPETAYEVKIVAFDGASNTSTSDTTVVTTKSFVGATVTGTVSNGQPVANAVVLLKGTTSYDTSTNDNGQFTLAGLKAGTYNVSVKANNETTTFPAVTLAAGDTKDLQTLTLNQYVSPTLAFIESTTKNAVAKELKVRIENTKGYVAYGTINAGKFTSSNGSTVQNVVAGDYTVTVYGEGLFKTTKKTITFDATKEYTVEVTKEDILAKDITLTLPAGVTDVSSVSLFSLSTLNKFQFEGKGSYNLYQPTVTNNTITIPDVIPATDYRLVVSARGYMDYSVATDLTTQTTIPVTLKAGRTITGTVKDVDGKTVQNVSVYASAGDTYASTYTDASGNYTLKNLSDTADIHVTAKHTAYVEYNKTISASDTNTLDIVLQKAVSMTGTVVDKDNKPLSGVSVYVSGAQNGWGRTDANGGFSVNGLVNGTYTVYVSAYGYPTVSLENKAVGNLGTIVVQNTVSTGYTGEGNSFNASKESVVPGDTIQYTLAYQKGGTANASNVPVTFTLPAGLTLVDDTIQLNGESVAMTNGKVIIPTVYAGQQGKITFKAKVLDTIDTAALTVTAKVTDTGAVVSATSSVVFATLQAPAQTNTQEVKVYGTAKLGSSINIYADGELVGQTQADSKWWYATIKLPVADLATKQEFKLSAKVTDGTLSASAQPMTVTYSPDVPVIKEATVYAGWNGNVKLNPYTGVATFAITENTAMDTKVTFDKNVDSAKLIFLGKEYDMTGAAGTSASTTFTFDGSKLGKWKSYGEQLLQVKYKRGDVEVTVPLMNIIVLIDPSGYVFEGTTDNRLQGVQAVVETKDANGEWVQWDAEKFGQVNPQITDENGRYGWDVINGEWRVVFTKEGYKPYTSRVMKVPPAETELNIPMVKLGDPVVETKAVTADDLTVTFDRYVKVAANTVKLYEKTTTGLVEVEGTVQTEDKYGYVAIEVPAAKQTGYVAADSNNETGFFAENTADKVSRTFKFVSTTTLKPETNYVLVANGDTADAERRTLGTDTRIEFTTGKPTVLQQLLALLQNFVGDFVSADFVTNAEALLALDSSDLDAANKAIYDAVKTKSDKLKALSYAAYTKYVPTTEKPVGQVTEKKSWTITLSEAVASTPENKALIEIQNMFGEKVENVTVDIKDNVITVTPTNSYVPNTNYTLVIKDGVKNADGSKTLSQGTSYTFQLK